MSPTIKKRLIFGSIVLVLSAFVLADAMHVFDTKDYIEVPHGNHTHYVPKDRDPNVPLENFPRTQPRPGETITPSGEVVRE